MRTYTLSLTTSSTYSVNQNIILVDDTNLARMKWFVNWDQFFKKEDYGKLCKIKVKMISDDVVKESLTHIQGLGYISATVPSTYGNMINGVVLGMTSVSASTDTLKTYLSVDTTQSCGISGTVPSSASELTIIFMDSNGNDSVVMQDYVCQLVFEIEN